MQQSAGNVAFLFTDIEGSTALWERCPEQMAVALARHDALLRGAVEACGGRVFKTVGDAFCAAFADAPGALAAALAAQQALHAEPWPEPAVIAVRMALHAGPVQVRDDDYFGATLNRIARLLAIGHGRQVLLSATVADAVRHGLPPSCALQDRGRHRLKDLHESEHVYELRHPVLADGSPPLRSLSTHPNNLPHQATSFVGREAEIARVKDLLAHARLVTLTGAGGCGKTRLAIQVTAELLERFADGAWLVELAALSDPLLVPRALMSALGLEQRPGAGILDSVLEQVGSRSALVVLDNAEHLVDACAQLAAALLRRCPNVVLLVTSRQPLQAQGEVALRVPSLSLPPLDGSQDAAQVARSEAARLFLERAVMHAPSFKLEDASAPAVASLCHRLDGIPLAIELAAARLRSMSVDEINARLGERFRLLTGGARTLLPRQQTLRSLIDWSYDLLLPAERALLRRLAVFAGGHALEEAEQACAGDGIAREDVLDLVASLVDKSLVVAEARTGTTRYHMLETVREYAWARLREHGEAATWQRRHFDCFLALAQRAEPALSGPEQQAWLERLEREHDNLRAALQWSAGTEGETEGGLRLATALWRFWYMRGHAGEGRACMTRLASTCCGGATSDLAKALTCAGMFAQQLGDYRAAVSHYEESLAMRRALGDRRGMASTLNNLGAAALEQGDPARARCLYEESLALVRELDDAEAIASVLGNLGGAAAEMGDYDASRTLQLESLALRRRLGDRQGIARSLGNLGNVHACLGDYQGARAHLEEAIAIFRDLGDPFGLAQPLSDLGSIRADEGDCAGARALFDECLALQARSGNVWGCAVALEGFAHVALCEGQPLRAARLWGCAAHLRERIGVPHSAVDRARMQAFVPRARAAAGDGAAFDAAWSEGRAMPLEHAVEFAREAVIPA
jgi:predicted ATPase/class 3 adenylate cyclase